MFLIVFIHFYTFYFNHPKLTFYACISLVTLKSYVYNVTSTWNMLKCIKQYISLARNCPNRWGVLPLIFACCIENSTEFTSEYLNDL
jgi:hypothetical protein